MTVYPSTYFTGPNAKKSLVSEHIHCTSSMLAVAGGDEEPSREQLRKWARTLAALKAQRRNRKCACGAEARWGFRTCSRHGHSGKSGTSRRLRLLRSA